MKIKHSLSAQIANSGKSISSADVLSFDGSETEYKELQKELMQLEKQKKVLLDRIEAFEAKQKAFVIRAEKLEAAYDGINSAAPIKPKGRAKSLAPAGSASSQLKEMQMSFSMQYLQLQSQMQHENRSYTAISNIMKTKHDTAKNSISNVR